MFNVLFLGNNAVIGGLPQMYFGVSSLRNSCGIFRKAWMADLRICRPISSSLLIFVGDIAGMAEG